AGITAALFELGPLRVGAPALPRVGPLSVRAAIRCLLRAPASALACVFRAALLRGTLGVVPATGLVVGPPFGLGAVLPRVRILSGHDGGLRGCGDRGGAQDAMPPCRTGVCRNRRTCAASGCCPSRAPAWRAARDSSYRQL